jgi:hypothetical protein
MPTKRLWSLNGLALELNRNFRTISRALLQTKPDATVAGRPRWHMQTAVRALTQHERRMEQQTGRVLTRPAPEKFDPVLEAKIHEVEITGKEADAFLAQLRALPTVAERRELVESGAGKVIGKHEKALEATIPIGDGDHAFTNQLYVDHMMNMILRELCALCEWTVADLTA